MPGLPTGDDLAYEMRMAQQKSSGQADRILAAIIWTATGLFVGVAAGIFFDALVAGLVGGLVLGLLLAWWRDRAVRPGR